MANDSYFWDWYEQAQQQAISASVPLGELDWLITHITNIDCLALRLKQFGAQVSIDPPLVQKLDCFWQKRLQERIPVQYLVGTVTWRNFELAVSPAVLIPRPETEAIVDLVAVHCQSSGATGTWIDLGTGSGAIAIGLAQALPEASIHAVDCSDAALEIARENAERCGVSCRIQFHRGNWFEPLAALKLQIDGMVSNPPYIPTEEIDRLQPEVAQHEPHLALDGGADGLEAIAHLVSTAPVYLAPGGYWLVEIMAGQAERVRSLLERQGSYTQIQIHRDFAGIDRFVAAICNF